MGAGNRPRADAQAKDMGSATKISVVAVEIKLGIKTETGWLESLQLASEKAAIK